MTFTSAASAAWRRRGLGPAMVQQEETAMVEKKRLRSAAWFDDPTHPVETAIYLERYFTSGLAPAELRSGRPIIGIAQTGSDLAPCNRHHLQLASRVKDGIRDA